MGLIVAFTDETLIASLSIILVLNNCTTINISMFCVLHAIKLKLIELKAILVIQCIKM